MGAVIAVFILAIFYEGLKTLRELLLYWDLKRDNDKKSCKRLSKDITSISSYEAVPSPDENEDKRRGKK